MIYIKPTLLSFFKSLALASGLNYTKWLEARPYCLQKKCRTRNLVFGKI